MTPAQAKRLKRLVNRFAKAEREKSWIGMQDPADRAGILTEYRLAKQAIDTYIIYLTREN